MIVVAKVSFFEFNTIKITFQYAHLIPLSLINLWSVKLRNIIVPVILHPLPLYALFLEFDIPDIESSVILKITGVELGKTFCKGLVLKALSIPGKIPGIICISN